MNRVTVVIVVNPGDEEALLRCLYAVEQQTYPRELVDVHLVHNVQGQQREAMCYLGAEKAGTEWVCFLHVNTEWPPEMLEQLMSYADDAPTTAFATVDGVQAGVIRREYYLEAWLA